METATLLVDTSFLGDVLLAEPLVRRLAARHPGPVDLLTTPAAAPLLEHHPDLREVLTFDKRGVDRGLGGMRRLAARLRARGYARVYCSHRSWRTAMLLAMARIPERIAYDNAAGGFFYTACVPYPEGKHEVERSLALAGGGDWERPRVHPTAAETARAAELLPMEGAVALAPGSVWATKRWPAAHFRTLAEDLLADGHQLVLLGGPDDATLTAGIADGLEGVLDLAGRCSLRESYAVLRRCAAVITNDSLPLHLGTAADIPVVALFCSTVPAFGFGPRGPRDRVVEVADLSCRPCGIHGHPACPEGHFRCGEDLAPALALEAVRAALREVPV